jgi:putative SOS response-associated peptidase YedK
MRLGLSDGGLFALAGLLDGDRFVVVTCAPSASVAHVHDRMPVVLPADAEAAWIDPAVAFDQVASALVPYAGALAACIDADPPPPKAKPAQGDLFG